MLIALRPLTNVATALGQEPPLKTIIEALIVMGGAIEVPGNTSPYAKANIYADPVAADAVFSSGILLKLVLLDICDQIYVQRDESDWPFRHSPPEQLARQILGNWFASCQERHQYSLCDPTVIVAALRPDLMTFIQAAVAVEAKDKTRTRQTTTSYSESNIQVVLGVQACDAKEFVRTLLTARGVSSKL